VQSRSLRFYAALTLFGVFFLLCTALGTWQVERRAWKLALIERVDARVHAAPGPAPDPLQWPHVNAANNEYLHVTLTGRFLHRAQTLVEASTELGPGWWVMTPLQLADGNIVFVNRGFVTSMPKAQADAPMPITVTGLLRMSEPHGRFMRTNDPKNNRWFSRDVTAIAAAQNLPAARIAPWFLDADAANAQATETAHAGQAQEVADEPIGGLTVISFYNHHLTYILTWYTLALMSAGAIVYLIRSERRRQQ